MDDLLSYLKFKLNDLLELIDRDVKTYELLRVISDLEKKISVNTNVLTNNKNVDVDKVNVMLRRLKEFALAYGFTSNIPYLPLLTRRTNPMKEEIRKKMKEVVLAIIETINQS